MHFTYIIRCRDNSLYTGYTTNVIRRMKEHEKGINSKYTRSRGFLKLEVCFVSDTKSKAMKLESYIKNLPRNKKLWLIENNEEFINTLEHKEEYKIYKEEALK